MLVALALVLGVGEVDGLAEVDGDAEALVDGLAVACGCTKISIGRAFGSVVCPAGFWFQTVPGVTGWFAGAGSTMSSPVKPVL